MKVKNLLTCLSLSLAFLTARSQNVQWAMPPLSCNMNGTSPAVSNIPNALSTSVPSNGAYDAAGHLLFYVQDLKLYTANGALLGQLPVPLGGSNFSGPEIEIVPVPGKEACNKFYVIYAAGGIQICYAEVDCHATGNPTVLPALGTVLSPTNYSGNILLRNYFSVQGLAVSKLTSSNVRYLFTVATPDPHDATVGGILKFTISSTGISAPVIAVANLDMYHNTYGSQGYFQWSATSSQSYQLSLSPDQTHLGWGGGSNGMPAMQNGFEVRFSNYTFVPNSYQIYWLNGSMSDYAVTGAVYDGQNRLWLSTQSNVYFVSGPGAVSQVPGSSVFTHPVGSQLAYVPASGLIVGVAQTATPGSGKFFSINPNTMSLNGSYMSGVAKPYLSNSVQSLFTLPDQIDGDVIAAPVPFTAGVTPAASTVCAGNPILAGGSYAGGTGTPDSFYWELDQCDQYGNSSGQITVSNFSSMPANPYTVPNSSNLPCGNYYKLIFGVHNSATCSNTATGSAVVYVSCNPAPVITGNTNICSGSSTTLSVNYPSPPNTDTWFIHKTQVSGQSITVSPTVGTTYVVKVTTADGCSSESSIFVNVATNVPSFDLTDNTMLPAYANISALANNAATTGNPGYKYMYILEELKSDLSATVWRVNGNPCIWWNFPNPTYFNDVQNAPLDYTGPTVGVIPSACGSYLPGQDQSHETFAEGQFQYGKPYRVTLGSWIINTADGSLVCPWLSSSQVIIPSYTGRLSAGPTSSVVFNDYAAPDFSAMQNEQGAATAIPEEESKLFSVYPNPNNGSFMVSTQLTGIQSVQVFDLNGRMVLNQLITGSAVIDASGLPAGIYQLRMQGDHVLENKKLVISK